MAGKLDELVLFDEHVDSIDFSEPDKKTVVKSTISSEEMNKVENEDEESDEVEVKFKAKKPKKIVKAKPVQKKEEEETEDDETKAGEEGVTEEVEETEEVESSEEIVSKYESLKELGYLYLPDDYQFDGTEEGLEKAVEDSEQYRMRDSAMDLWNQLPESFRPLLEYALKGGTDINKFKEVFVEVNNPESLDLSNEDNQRSVIRELYKQRGFSDLKIQKDITRIEDSGDLEEEAKEAATELQNLRKSRKDEEFRRVELQKKEREIKEQEAYNLLKTTLEGSEDFNGYVIPKQKHNEVISSLYNKTRDEDGNFTTDFNYKLNKVVLRDPRLVLVLSDLMNRIKEDESGNRYFDFSHINKKAESEAAKKLKKSIDIAAGTASKISNSSAVSKTASTFDWDSIVI